jgi:hypothetical protein
VPGFTHTERISRQQAAERLTDVAYAMVVRSPETLQVDGEQIRVPDGEELLVQWSVSYAGDRLQFEMQVRSAAAELPAVA